MSTSLTGHEGAVQCVALAPNDAYLVRHVTHITHITHISPISPISHPYNAYHPYHPYNAPTGLRVVGQHLPRVGVATRLTLPPRFPVVGGGSGACVRVFLSLFLMFCILVNKIPRKVPTPCAAQHAQGQMGIREG